MDGIHVRTRFSRIVTRIALPSYEFRLMAWRWAYAMHWMSSMTSLNQFASFS